MGLVVWYLLHCKTGFAIVWYSVVCFCWVIGWLGC